MDTVEIKKDKSSIEWAHTKAKPFAKTEAPTDTFKII